MTTAAVQTDEFKPSYADHLIDAMSRGLTVQASMAEIGYCREAAYVWAKKHPEMERALKLGKAKRVLFLEGLLISISSTGVGNIAGVIFALKNADPEEWRDIAPPPAPPVTDATNLDLLMLAQKLAYILTRGDATAKHAGKLIEGKARPNGANGHTNGHG